MVAAQRKVTIEKGILQNYNNPKGETSNTVVAEGYALEDRVIHQKKRKKGC